MVNAPSRLTEPVTWEPATLLSPGQDKDGNPKPFVEVGQKIELTEAQVLQLEGQGHQFFGRQVEAGQLLRGTAAGSG